MNLLFLLMVTVSLLFLLFRDPAAGVSAAIAGAGSAVELSIKMLAVYALWLGVLGVMKANGVTAFVTRLFRPITKRLFKGEKEETHSLIAQNFAANFLGIGSAATPLGIQAVSSMQGEREEATENTVLFLVINACGVQFLPATIIALREQSGSLSPADILLPTVLSTILTAAIGITLCLLKRGLRLKRSLG